MYLTEPWRAVVSSFCMFGLATNFQLIFRGKFLVGKSDSEINISAEYMLVSTLAFSLAGARFDSWGRHSCSYWFGIYFKQ